MEPDWNGVGGSAFVVLPTDWMALVYVRKGVETMHTAGVVTGLRGCSPLMLRFGQLGSGTNDGAAVTSLDGLFRPLAVRGMMKLSGAW